MRISRKAGLLASSALCGALALGAAGPAFSSVTDAPARSGSSESVAPLPGAEALAKQNTALAGAGAVVQPVTDLVAGVLKAPDGKLPKDEATKHAADVKKALDGLAAGAKAATDKAGAPGARAQAPGPELVAKAAADLQTKVDALVKASAAGDAKATAAALQATLTGTVNVVVAIVLGGDLPAPDLKGLPKLPTLPGVDPAQTLPSL
ncbi:hypothetical protein [Streptomyces endophyticus]|uniref:ATP-binding protein n=1 Tax=Streptomyces endophyticus TaxID=714166 RepID=A0ABU6FDJ3_9ACTN|nr:hypothetical protein [Streptomyces endophyticus]MEB8342116.1 hypothetical protein [Streptomyces endophyticus]